LKTFAFNENSSKWCQPFAVDISNYPALNVSNTTSTNEFNNEKDDCIPNHLPAFPPPHTYKRSGLGKRNFEHGEESLGKNVSRSRRVEAVKSAQQSLLVIEDIADTAADENIV
jgi:hypothetical protein